MENHRFWWQETTIYQVYPRSFKDSNDDGIGDLQGIISKLDYIQDLGFETIWLNPIFASPERDFGYDICDYRAISPDYGDLEDVRTLIDQVHQRGMRILIDLVLNHTSDHHPWFQEARSSRQNPKRDWYIWLDGRNGSPPNNWRSILGASGWQHDPGTDQWYYASFLPFQPDLNYRNPEVVNEMLAVVKYWLDMGVDGYRLDIFHSLYKDAHFRDNPWSYKLIPRNFRSGYLQDWRFNFNQPETIEFARQLRTICDNYTPPRLLLGEVYADDSTLKKYLGEELDGLHLVFLWDLLKIEPSAEDRRKVLKHYESSFSDPYTPVYVFGNHDQPRLVSRIQGGAQNAALLAVFQLIARGVPVTYYGEELGMTELAIASKNSRDPVGKRFSWVPDFVWSMLDFHASRDGCRSPMQWKPGVHAGFSSPGVEPWLPVNEDSELINVEVENNFPDSLLNVYRQLLRIRKDLPALRHGHLEIIDPDQTCPQVLAFRRYVGEESSLVLINFGQSACTVRIDPAYQQVVFRLGKVARVGEGQINLEAASAVVLNRYIHGE